MEAVSTLSLIKSYLGGQVNQLPTSNAYTVFKS